MGPVAGRKSFGVGQQRLPVARRIPPPRTAVPRLESTISTTDEVAPATDQLVTSQDTSNLKPAMTEPNSCADPTSRYPIGSKVSVRGTITGILLFRGDTGFATGTWCGIALDEPGGKNNGSVNGIRYFACAPNHGVFVRPQNISLVQEMEGFETSRLTDNKSNRARKSGDNLPLPSWVKSKGGFSAKRRLAKPDVVLKLADPRRKSALKACLNATTISSSSASKGKENKPTAEERSVVKEEASMTAEIQNSAISHEPTAVGQESIQPKNACRVVRQFQKFGFQGARLGVKGNPVEKDGTKTLDSTMLLPSIGNPKLTTSLVMPDSGLGEIRSVNEGAGNDCKLAASNSSALNNCTFAEARNSGGSGLESLASQEGKFEVESALTEPSIPTRNECGRSATQNSAVRIEESLTCQEIKSEAKTKLTEPSIPPGTARNVTRRPLKFQKLQKFGFRGASVTVEANPGKKDVPMNGNDNVVLPTRGNPVPKTRPVMPSRGLNETRTIEERVEDDSGHNSTLGNMSIPADRPAVSRLGIPKYKTNKTAVQQVVNVPNKKPVNSKKVPKFQKSNSVKQYTPDNSNLPAGNPQGICRSDESLVLPSTSLLNVSSSSFLVAEDGILSTPAITSSPKTMEIQAAGLDQTFAKVASSQRVLEEVVPDILLASPILPAERMDTEQVVLLDRTFEVNKFCYEDAGCVNLQETEELSASGMFRIDHTFQITSGTADSGRRKDINLEVADWSITGECSLLDITFKANNGTRQAYDSTEVTPKAKNSLQIPEQKLIAVQQFEVSNESTPDRTFRAHNCTTVLNIGSRDSETIQDMESLSGASVRTAGKANLNVTVSWPSAEAKVCKDLPSCEIINMTDRFLAPKLEVEKKKTLFDLDLSTHEETMPFEKFTLKNFLEVDINRECLTGACTPPIGQFTPIGRTEYSSDSPRLLQERLEFEESFGILSPNQMKDFSILGDESHLSSSFCNRMSHRSCMQDLFTISEGGATPSSLFQKVTSCQRKLNSREPRLPKPMNLDEKLVMSDSVLQILDTSVPEGELVRGVVAKPTVSRNQSRSEGGATPGSLFQEATSHMRKVSNDGNLLDFSPELGLPETPKNDKESAFESRTILHLLDTSNSDVKLVQGVISKPTIGRNLSRSGGDSFLDSPLNLSLYAAPSLISDSILECDEYGSFF